MRVLLLHALEHVPEARVHIPLLLVQDEVTVDMRLIQVERMCLDLLQ